MKLDGIIKEKDEDLQAATNKSKANIRDFKVSSFKRLLLSLKYLLIFPKLSTLTLTIIVGT